MHFEPSVMFLHYNSRLLTGLDKEGSTLWATARALKAKGICSESLWPFDLAKSSVEPSVAAYKEAYNNRSGYYEYLDSQDQIRQFISNSGAINISFDMFESFTKADWNGIVPIPKLNERKIGQHAVLIIGYETHRSWVYPDDTVTQGFYKFQNSWGPDWGDNGFGYLPFEYVEQHMVENSVLSPQLINKRNAFKIESVIKSTRDKETVRMRRWLGESAKENHVMFIHELFNSQDVLVGWAIARINKGKENIIEIIDLFVWPDHRFKGYGTILFDSLQRIEPRLNRLVFGFLSRDDSEQDTLHSATLFLRKRGLQLTECENIYRRSRAILYANFPPSQKVK